MTKKSEDKAKSDIKPKSSKPESKSSNPKSKFLKIKEVARLTGLSEQCLRNWDDKGVFKCHHRSEKGGYRYYTQEQVDEYLEKAKRQIKVVGYCRVGSSNTCDLARQRSVLYTYISKRDIDRSNFIIVEDEVKGLKLGEGLSGLIKDISNNLVKELIVEDKTRLSLTDFNLIELVAKAHNCKVTVLSDISKVTSEDILEDAKEVLINFLDNSLNLTSKDDLKMLLGNVLNAL